MQIIAEQRIENGLLSVTLKILNLPNCLYTKISCNFFQSYEKTSEMQKENCKKLAPMLSRNMERTILLIS